MAWLRDFTCQIKTSTVENRGVIHGKSSILRMVFEHLTSTQDSKGEHVLWRYTDH